MTKPINQDVKALKGAVRALDQSSSVEMVMANLEYLWDRYIRHPNAETLAPWNPVEELEKP